MTNAINSITIVLEHNMREDDAQALLNAVQMLKGVITARANVSGLTDYIAQARARYEYGCKLMGVIYPDQKP